MFVKVSDCKHEELKIKGDFSETKILKQCVKCGDIIIVEKQPYGSNFSFIEEQNYEVI